jgi:glycosyltransferase involved in cell wall biosynthesis
MQICHLTSVHNRYDTRVFIKMCSSLANTEGFDVTLIVADGKGNEVKNNVSIIDAGARCENRIYRMTKTVGKIFQKAKEQNSDIYHLHDPELIPVGLKLKKLKKKVIFDIHENVYLQIKDKNYLPFFLRSLIAKLYRYYELRAITKFDKLILAELSYQEYYSRFSSNIVTILNMPQLSMMGNYLETEKKNEFFYIGWISIDRGIDVLLAAIEILKKEIPDIFFHFIGQYDLKLSGLIHAEKENKNLKFYGPIPLNEGIEYARNCKAGLSILKPIDNHTRSYSTKIFEYMALGLPVITSNFQLYKDIVENEYCGICVDPLDPQEISDAIMYIINHPEEAKRMGQNGRMAVLNKYNWKKEEEKLLSLYEELIV